MNGTETTRRTGLISSHQRVRIQRRIERSLCGGYVIFFAFLLPFLCWGTLADPTHPHQGAHFIFAELPAAHTSHGGQIVIREHEPCLHPPGAHPPLSTLASHTPIHGPVKQAIPTTLLAELLLVIMWIAVEIRCRPLAQLVQVLVEMFCRDDHTRVPTPPPRHLYPTFA